jgi:FHA domain
LEGYTAIGRLPHCGLRLTDDRVSNDHAFLRWGSDGWTLRDTGSTNGSWLNDQPLRPRTDVAVKAGDSFSLGSRDLTLSLEDDSAPLPMAYQPLGGEPCVISDGVITIPEGDNALASIFRGLDGAWTLECGDRVRSILSGDLVEVAGQVWRFSSPSEWQPTKKIAQVRLVSTSTFQFDVSADGEAVTLNIEHDGQTVAMGNRSAHDLLLTLALRRNEEQSKFHAGEAGWMHREELMRMHRCDESRLNVWIWRLREQFGRHDFIDHASVIERRDRTGQLRIGVAHNVIRRGS